MERQVIFGELYVPMHTKKEIDEENVKYDKKNNVPLTHI